ncbi:MAG: winged helix-turn-helix transcriptional regulator [Veillonellaceae bacterium]|nr:winged helix-turn-helix transcriptional regulator [Veillonellaceae bacterium]
MSQDYAGKVPAFKALSDETRLKILDMLSCGEMCACDILSYLSITQPTLSYHMKILVECGLVSAARDGSWMRYRLDKATAEDVLTFLEQITSDQDDCIFYAFRKQKQK